MITANHVEYLTRKVFKGKTPEAAAKAMHKEFSGTTNMFLGGVQNFTVDELVDAYYQDKANTLKKQLAKTPIEKHVAAKDAFCSYFKCNPDKLNRYLSESVILKSFQIFIEGA